LSRYGVEAVLVNRREIHALREELPQRPVGILVRSPLPRILWITPDIVMKALLMAISARKLESDLLHHSDRGSQYASGDFQSLLTEHGIECSMSGAGNCYDDAVVESWFRLLKR